MVGKDNVVKMKPGQILHIVNQLYQYTIQFKVDATTNQVASKRPLKQTFEQREGHKEEPSVKAAKLHEKLPVEASQKELKQGNVKDESKSVSPHFLFIYLVSLMLRLLVIQCVPFRTVLAIGAKV